MYLMEHVARSGLPSRFSYSHVPLMIVSLPLAMVYGSDESGHDLASDSGAFLDLDDIVIAYALKNVPTPILVAGNFIVVLRRRGF